MVSTGHIRSNSGKVSSGGGGGLQARDRAKRRTARSLSQVVAVSTIGITTKNSRVDGGGDTGKQESHDNEEGYGGGGWWW